MDEALKFARELKTKPLSLEDLIKNEENIEGLLHIIELLKKEVYEKQRDNDVLYFELQCLT
jgi:hypothetical protein